MTKARVRRSSATPKCGSLLHDNSKLTGRVLRRKRHTGTRSSGVLAEVSGRVPTAERMAENVSAKSLSLSERARSTRSSTRGQKSVRWASPAEESGLRTGADQTVVSEPVQFEENETWEDAEEGDISLEMPERNDRSSSATTAAAGKTVPFVRSDEVDSDNAVDTAVLVDIIARVTTAVLASERARKRFPVSCTAVPEILSAPEMFSAPELFSARVASTVSRAGSAEAVCKGGCRVQSVIELPTFDGVTQSWEGYSNQFDAARILHGWTDSEAAVQLKALLRGRAADVMISEESVTWSLERLMSELKEKYSAKTLAEHYQFQIQTRRRRKGEPLTELYGDFARLSLLAYPKDQHTEIDQSGHD